MKADEGQKARFLRFAMHRLEDGERELAGSNNSGVIFTLVTFASAEVQGGRLNARTPAPNFRPWMPAEASMTNGGTEVHLTNLR